jgi:glutamine---fructose-6-phosphate transaminase (isomerizing)
MCGIIAGLTISSENICDFLLMGLGQLQNRGYDSAGICTPGCDGFIVTKHASTQETPALRYLETSIDLHKSANIGIAHTRWATHGAKTTRNSHPHVSSDGKFSIVHNGIIENYKELRRFLIDNGFTFNSETDSEVIANLLSYHYKQNANIVESIRLVINMLSGTWGVVIMCIDLPNALYCTRHGSPLLVSHNDTKAFIVSEQSGFCGQFNNYFVLKQNDICCLSINDVDIKVETNRAYQYKPVTVQIDKVTPAPFSHWTIKEIYDQSTTVKNVIGCGGRLLSNNQVKLGGLEHMQPMLTQLDNIILLGCGTSYHAGMIGLHYFKELCNFYCVQLFDGAEFTEHDIPRGGKTGVVLLSQSGETKDLHRCITLANDYNLLTIGVVNVVDSLIAREVSCGCYLNAGREVAVASTKSFTSQVIMLSMIAIWFSQNQGINEMKRLKYVRDLYNLQLDVATMLSSLDDLITPDILDLFNDQNSCFILGKGKSEAIAREGALKIKEITYLHTEGYSSSSLKHGPFALLRDKFPVVLISPFNEHVVKNENAYEEIKSRGAKIIVVSDTYLENNCPHKIIVPRNETFCDLLCMIPLQMIAYKLSLRKGIDPDMPRNLAKVVTVE